MSKSDKEKYMKAFGLQLKNLRSIQKLTQQDLSERSEISASYISKIERGHADPSLDTLFSLSVALRVKPVSLMDFNY